MSEAEVRSQTCSLIREIGIKLKLPQLTIATAIVFFHKFFQRSSFAQQNLLMIATSALFLAGKVEETPKKLQDVISVAYLIYFKRELKINSQEYLEVRESVLKRERLILQTIGFRFTVAHPYKYILEFTTLIKLPKVIAQTAWNFVNDSLRTTMCLTKSPQIIAAATLFLAARYHETDIPFTSDATGQKYFLQFKIEELEETSNKILDLYTSNPEASADKNNQQQSSDSKRASNSQSSTPRSNTSNTPTPNSTPNHNTRSRYPGDDSERRSQRNSQNNSRQSSPVVLRGDRPLPVATPSQQHQLNVIAPNSFDALFESIHPQTNTTIKSDPTSTASSPNPNSINPTNVSCYSSSKNGNNMMIMNTPSDLMPQTEVISIKSREITSTTTSITSTSTWNEIQIGRNLESTNNNYRYNHNNLNIRTDVELMPDAISGQGNGASLVMRKKDISPISHKFAPY